MVNVQFGRVGRVVACFGLLLALGCDKDDGGGAGTRLTDPQIAAVTKAANDGEVQAGNLAVSKAMSDDVRSFGQDMVNEHTEANRKQNELTARLGLAPVDNDLSRQLQSEAATAVTALQPRAGADFDVAYMDSQITMHTRVLDLLDTRLISEAQNQELQSFLRDARGTVAGHLEDARSLRSRLTMP